MLRRLHFHDVARYLPRFRNAAMPIPVTFFSSTTLDSIEEDHEDNYDRDYSTLERLMRFKSAINEDDSIDPDDEGVDDELALDGDPDPRHKLGKRLLNMGNVHYRHVDNLPDWISARQQRLCSNRTPAQIRRCMKTAMLKVDRDLLVKYRSKPLKWGELLPIDKSEQKAIEYGPEEAITYAYYHMPSRFIITKRVFQEIEKLVPSHGRALKVIDFGCGPGTAAAAAFATWGEKVKYTGVDMSQSMLDAAKLMTNGLLPDSIFWDKTSEVVKRAETRGERFDVAIISYTLSELKNDPTRRAITQLMFELLDVGGLLVVIEPGNPQGSHAVRTARQFVLDTFNNVEQNGVSKSVRSTFYQGNIDENGQEIVRESRTARLDALVTESLSAKDQKLHAKQQSKDIVRMLLPCSEDMSSSGGYSAIGASIISPCTHDKPCPLNSGLWCSFAQKV
jgi:ubiquinone/menaquinone biosynthesis C-methylase UbiE